MLCHDHASTFKLPELDAETSMQDKIEKLIDEKYDQIATKKLKKVQQVTPDKNPFFPGISGDKDTGTEAKISKTRFMPYPHCIITFSRLNSIQRIDLHESRPLEILVYAKAFVLTIALIECYM
jgi:hypothetical protein